MWRRHSCRRFFHPRPKRPEEPGRGRRDCLRHVSRSDWLLAVALLAGCGRYADFTLRPPAGAPEAVNFTLHLEPAPVLMRGAPGEWDSHDALNPAIVRQAGAYFNLYSGFDGATWRTGLATSADGFAWRKQGVVLAPDPATWEGSYIAANGAALFFENRFWYWYVGGPKDTPRIGLARSPDGRRWTKEPAPVLDAGPRGSWDERGVADPYAMRAGADLYLFYLGQDRARRQRLGLARSRDGLHWQKLRANPILELGEYGAIDEQGLGEPAVWEGQGWYWMLYTGRDRSRRRRMGLAQSRDGVRWRKLPLSFAGDSPWNVEAICDPEVEPSGATVRVWFGGGDRPRLDENLDGQIGVATLSHSGATLAK